MENAAAQVKDLNGLPPTFTKWGKALTAVGRGLYPYECEEKDKHPNAMIYRGEGSWTNEHSYEFLNRD